MTDSIIFDLDGTLWDSTTVVAPAWNAVLDKRTDIAFRATPDNLKKLFGRPLPVIAEIIFPELPGPEQQALIHKCNESEHEFLNKTSGELFPGVKETLETLSKTCPLFIVSNCEAGYIELFLEATGFAPYFKDHECPGNTGKYKAENIRLVMERNHLQHPVYVGDTQGDADASREAGIPFFFASYGFGAVDACDAEVTEFSQLPAVLKEREV